jgi:hypothetical protein
MMTAPLNPIDGKVGNYILLNNPVEMAFTVLPAGVENEAGGKMVVLDLSRTIEERVWQQQPGGQIGNGTQTQTFPAFREIANDDTTSNDEDSIPKNQTIYALDTPGWIIGPYSAQDWTDRNLSAGYVRLVRRMNAHEFVRVKVGGGTFHTPDAQGKPTSGNGFAGSRASELVNWRSWVDFTWDANDKKWVRTPDTPQNVYNELKIGHENLNTPALS